MKKFKIGMSLALSVLTLASISSCKITEKDDLVLTYSYKTSDGTTKTREINAEDVYQRYLKKDPKDHAKAYYDAIYDVAVRIAFKQENGVLHKYLSTVEDEANTAITNAKNEADENDQDWDDYLAAKGYDDDALSDEENEHLFYLDKELEAMKSKVSEEYDEEFNDWVKDATDSSYSDQQKYNKLWGEQGYFEMNMPYAVRHLLVKCGDSSDNFTSSKISSTQVDKLHRVFNNLVNTNTTTNTFGSIIKAESEDTGSASRYGTYVMGTKTSFVNEFKLGVYAYESIFNSETSDKYNDYLENKQKSNANFIGFGENEDAKKTIEEVGVNFVPYEAIERLYEYKDVENINGQTVNEGNESYYPRNILFNKYFNVHNVSFITNEKCAVTGTSTYEEDEASLSSTGLTYSDNGKKVYTDLDSKGKYQNSSTTYFATTSSEASHFKEFKINGETKSILVDEKGNPIIMVVNATSSGGIHLITIEKDYLDFIASDGTATETYTVSDENAKGGSYEVAINEYYAPESPIYQDGRDRNGNPYYNVDSGSYKGEFPQYETVDGTYAPKETFINSDIVTTKSDYDSIISSTITSEIDSNSYISNDSIQSKNEFAWLTSQTNLTAKNETAKELIQMYQDNLENTSLYSDNKTLNDSWTSYATTLENQQNDRKYGLIPETCALHFKDAGDSSDKYYKQGGICYYSTKVNQ